MSVWALQAKETTSCDVKPARNSTDMQLQEFQPNKSSSSTTRFRTVAPRQTREMETAQQEIEAPGLLGHDDDARKDEQNEQVVQFPNISINPEMEGIQQTAGTELNSTLSGKGQQSMEQQG
ncbi:unnamed protein product, partial [Amoebophrya sp. A25]|eukprot:GSA25T00003389001.1